MGALEFGQLIKQARLRRGWQQQDLADRIGVDRGYISTIENGKRNWPQSYIDSLADALGLDQVQMAIAAGLITPQRDRPVESADPVRDELMEKLREVELSEERADTLERVLDLWRDFDRRKPHILDEEPIEDVVGATY